MRFSSLSITTVPGSVLIGGVTPSLHSSSSRRPQGLDDKETNKQFFPLAPGKIITRTFTF